MTKDNDWVLRAQREAAHAVSTENQTAAQAALQKQKEAAEKIQDSYDRDERAKQLLEQYLGPLNKYVAALNASGFIASAKIEVQTFHGRDGHVQIHEDFTKAELDQEAAARGKELPHSLSLIQRIQDFHKKTRLIMPLSQLNRRSEEIGGDQSSSFWESSCLHFSVQRNEAGRMIEVYVVIGSVKDIEYKVTDVTEARGTGRNSTSAEISTKIISSIDQPLCAVITVKGPTEARSVYGGPPTRKVLVANSLEEFDSIMAEFLSETVKELETLHLKELEKIANETPPKKKKRIFGLF